MEGRRDRATCPACGLEVVRADGPPGTLSVRTREGVSRPVHATVLAARIDALGGALARATGPDGCLAHAADVLVRTAGSEVPVRLDRRLLGFAERFGRGSPGRLELTPEVLRLVPGGPRSGAGAGPPPASVRQWPLESLRALQTSSSAVQVTTDTPAGQGTGVVLFRFVEDSPRRWDELLRHAISRRWEALGLGQVIEFQPRIRVDEATGQGPFAGLHAAGRLP
jgi:hypothetical protein